MDIDRNSWHYKLASFFGFHSDYYMDAYCSDICSYTRKIIMNTGITIVLALISFGLLYVIADCLAWLAAGLIEHFVMANFWSVVFMAIVVVILVLAAILFFVERIKDFFSSRPMKERQPSFVAEAYRAMKDRYCVKLEFKDKNLVDEINES